MSEEMNLEVQKRILFVDDEESLALLGADLLEDYGYQVQCAFNGQEALDLFNQQQSSFDIVITDESMPGMTGIELAQEIYRQAAGIPVILCSGHMLTMREEGMDQTNIKSVLSKTDVCMKLPDLLEQILTSSP